MKDVIQHLNILKSHKNETYSVNDGRVKVTGKPSKYFSLTGTTNSLTAICFRRARTKHFLVR